MGVHMGLVERDFTKTAFSSASIIRVLYLSKIFTYIHIDKSDVKNVILAVNYKDAQEIFFGGLLRNFYSVESSSNYNRLTIVRKIFITKIIIFYVYNSCKSIYDTKSTVGLTQFEIYIKINKQSNCIGLKVKIHLTNNINVIIHYNLKLFM